MRFFALVSAGLLAVSLSAWADSRAAEAGQPDASGPPKIASKDQPAAPLAPPEKPAAKLERLFGELKRERNEKAAERLAARIWSEWGRSGSATVDLMMFWSQEAMNAKKWDVALDFLDQVTVMRPAYAEGWNRRATVHFMMDSYAKSMADIEKTLELEPRHFGALAGMAMILKNTDRKQKALEAYERVLALYPMNRSAQGEVATLSDELAGEGI